MQELLAIELRSETSTNDDARAFIDEWVLKHDGNDANVTGMAVTESTADSGAAVFVVEQPDSSEPDRLWRTEVAVGAPADPAHVTVRVRIGSSSAAAVAPVSYQLGTPAIVRTLLRELDVVDGGVRCLAGVGPEIGPSDVEGLYELLVTERKLPVVVVSRCNDTGALTLNQHQLARELAGLAHVRVLSSSFSSRRLTEFVGNQLSVFDGAVRVYFDGFGPDSDRGDHRLLFRDRMNDQTVEYLQDWLGSLSAAVTPEHPVYAELRTERHRLVEGASDEELRKLIAGLEADSDRERFDTKIALARAAAAEREAAKLRFELDAAQENFKTIGLAQRSAGAAAGERDGEGLSTVAAAMDAIEELANSYYYRTRVEVTDAALKAGRKFKEYAAPDEMVRAVHAVLEAGALAYDKVLGESPSDFFSRRRYGYRTGGGPHLKVDESTSSDQCLRIYWDTDTESGRWRITSIGEHK